MATIKVTAGEGRTVPLHHSVATAPGAGLKLLVAPEEIEVDDANVNVQRSLRDGDLVRVAPAPEAAPATETPQDSALLRARTTFVDTLQKTESKEG